MPDASDDALSYSIAAIPTAYGGREYRSRLEARWAAFFDLLGWRHEHEPFDLGQWSPDFLLVGDDARALVEVKPITEPHEPTISKMEAALKSASARPDLEVALLVGAAPFRDAAGRVQIGWSITTGRKAESAFVLWVDGGSPSLVADFGPEIGPVAGFYGVMTGGAQPLRRAIQNRPMHWPEHSMGLWHRACRIVQWGARA